MTRRTPHKSNNVAFSQVLEEELRKAAERGLLERDIATRAGIDVTLLPLLKRSGQKNSRIKNPSLDVRLQLAVGLQPDEPETVAHRLIKAPPTPKGNLAEWPKLLTGYRLKLLQTERLVIDFGLPLFFDTAPFLLAEKKRYFIDAGLDAFRFHYLKWPQVLDWVTRREPADDSDSRPSTRKHRTLRLSVYNRSSIERDSRSDTVRFCFPISIYEPKAFAFLVRKESRGADNEGVGWRERVRHFLEKTEFMPRIVVSGTDMKIGAEQMFRKAGFERELKEDWFVVLGDPFDALTAFLGCYDAFVGGVPQRIRAERMNATQTLADGDEIGLATQFNGIVCSAVHAVNDATKGAVAQLLSAWYRALQDINRSLDEASKMIADEMNLHSGGVYEPSDFIEFWRSTNYFHFPENPSTTMNIIADHPDYRGQKRYDDTNIFFRAGLDQLEHFYPNLNNDKFILSV